VKDLAAAIGAAAAIFSEDVGKPRRAKRAARDSSLRGLAQNESSLTLVEGGPPMVECLGPNVPALEESTMSDEKKTLYERLGGYDAITAVANDLLPRLRTDPQLGRFWAHRGEDGVKREKQLLIDFLCASAGGPTYYRGRDMVLTHRGMRISESDWNVFLGHAAATLAKFQVPDAEQRDVVAFVQSLKKEIVE
jgi:hemoglobin